MEKEQAQKEVQTLTIILARSATTFTYLWKSLHYKCTPMYVNISLFYFQYRGCSSARNLSK